MDTVTCLESISILVGIITFVVAHLISRKHDRDVANRQMYQTLEFASIDLFKFEADNIDLIRALWEPNAAVPAANTAEREACNNYVCQFLNLFEMAVRFRKLKIVPTEVFGSWVVCMFDVCNAPSFAHAWANNRLAYIPEFRKLMDKGVELAKNEPQEDPRRQKFFEYFAWQLKCPTVSQWLDHN